MVGYCWWVVCSEFDIPICSYEQDVEDRSCRWEEGSRMDGVRRGSRVEGMRRLGAQARPANPVIGRYKFTLTVPCGSLPIRAEAFRADFHLEAEVRQREVKTECVNCCSYQWTPVPMASGHTPCRQPTSQVISKCYEKYNLLKDIL